MNQIFLNVMAASNQDGWSISQFLKKITDFFTSNYWVTELVRALVIGLVLFCVVAFIVSGTFLKIVKEEMEKGGEEYGEIAATKVSNRAYLLRVLSVVFGSIIVIALFMALALL